MKTALRGQLVLGLVLLLPALWAANFLIARSASGIIGPHMLALQRWVLAALVFCLMSHRELRAQWRTVLAEWPHMLVLGALGMWICGAWVYVAAHSTGATNMALIYSLSPVLIIVVSGLWLGERLSPRQALGVGLAFLGVLHVVVQGRWSNLLQVRLVAGDFWILGAALSWTFFTLLLKRWSTSLGSNARLAAISVAGVLVLLPFALWEAVTGPVPAFSAEGFVLALLAALLPGFGAYLVYDLLIRQLGTMRAGVVLYLVPPYAAVLAWLVLGEPIRGFHLLGLALILPGIYLANRRGPPVPAEPGRAA